MGRANAFSAAFKDYYFCPKGCGRKSSKPELAEKHGAKCRFVRPSAPEAKEVPKCWSCGTTEMKQVAPGARNFVHLPGCKR